MGPFSLSFFLSLSLSLSGSSLSLFEVIKRERERERESWEREEIRRESLFLVKGVNPSES